MGVERAVTRWFVQRQLLLDEITLLTTKIASPSTNGDEIPQQSENDVAQKLAQAQEKLRTLGSCPRPMMG